VETYIWIEFKQLKESWRNNHQYYKHTVYLILLLYIIFNWKRTEYVLLQFMYIYIYEDYKLDWKRSSTANFFLCTRLIPISLILYSFKKYIICFVKNTIYICLFGAIRTRSKLKIDYKKKLWKIVKKKN
jgi:hypothetical protein